MTPILLKNCLIYETMSGAIVKTDILLENGKIKDMTNDIHYEAQNLQIHDIQEHIVMPGLIDSHTHVGIIEEGTGKIGMDNNETSNPVTPHLRAIDAINPMDIAFSDAVRAGITCVMSGPGSNNVVGGLSTAIKTHGSIIDQMILRNPIGLKIAFGENPLTTYGKNNQCPVTRMGTASLIRELFMRAQDYMFQKEQGKITERDIQLEAVIPVLKHEISLRAHAHRADDIITAVRIAEEFGINKLVIEHGTEANFVKEFLKEKNIPVAYGPMLMPRTKMELKKRNYTAVVELNEAGIKTALITDHPYNSIDQLRTVATIAISEGLKPFDAVKCLTQHPAEILDCENRIGKLQIGYDADLAIFDGDPFQINTNVIMTILNGEIVYEAQK